MYRTFLLGLLQAVTIHTAIVPPPWADSSLNPCATQPGGWLFLFWPPDGKCYRIFQRGHPCPETMELGPVQDAKTKKMIAECKCPPGTAQSARDAKCHQIFSKGPCRRGQYFSPVPDNNRRRWGKCMDTDTCRDNNELYWAPTGGCYPKYSRGPCQQGQLLTHNKDTGLTECKCESTGTMSKFYWSAGKACYQWYTKGPCLEKGTLYLPGPRCDCSPTLPNYHNDTGMCYELGGLGPCKPGHKFQLTSGINKGTCVCKPDHVEWSDGHCYRLYTRGPCNSGQILFNSTTCADIPCRKGRLYFPEDDSCYRIGVRGPCAGGQLVLFEKSIRPSIEGISYRGMCGCPGADSDKCEPVEGKQTADSTDTEASKLTYETVAEESRNIAAGQAGKPQQQEKQVRVCDTTSCYILYTQGPCEDGEWLVPLRQARGRRSTHVPRSIGVYLNGNSHRFKSTNQGEVEQEQRLYQETDSKRRVKIQCECKQGYVRVQDRCQVPYIQLATFLNGQDYFAP